MKWIQQVLAIAICVILAATSSNAVVNKAQSTLDADTDNKASNNNSIESETDVRNSVADSEQAGSDHEATRRDAPPLLTDSYGAPLSVGALDSYAPSGSSNPGLPFPVYGVPDAPSNNVIYPEVPPDIPPPEIPPPLSSVGIEGQLDLSHTYGPPEPLSSGPQSLYGAPHGNGFGLSINDNYGPPPLPTNSYGPPRFQKPHLSQSFHIPKGPKLGPPRPLYGPPKPQFTHKLPKPYYGPPKFNHGPRKPIHLPKNPIYGPPKFSNNYGPPKLNFGPPKDNYGPPNNVYGPPVSLHHNHQGPPEPIPHGPPHPGAPAPPTPPDIKYDGWQPIPGLISHPPSDTYGSPDAAHHHHQGIGDLQFNTDFTPPPVGSGQQNHLSLDSHGLQTIDNSYSSGSGVRDSYGAPLNSVTGSGGVVSSSGESHSHSGDISLGLSAAGLSSGQDNSLSVIKSIGYEIFPQPNGQYNHVREDDGNFNTHGHFGNNHGGHVDTYNAPPLNSYSLSGPYAAAHSYKSNSGLSSIGSFGSSHRGKSQRHNGLSISSSGIGLIPPSGIYGAPPSSHYGTPLISSPHSLQGPPLNALEINPPKYPIAFREPVPHGLIESIGKNTAEKDARGIIESVHTHSYKTGPTYLPPPVPDVGRPIQEELKMPSNLYSLPSFTSPVSFNTFAQGSSSAGLSHGQFHTNSYIDSGHSVNNGAQHASALTSYTAPLATVDGSYGVPSFQSTGSGYNLGELAVGLDHSHAPLTIDLSQQNFGSGFSNTYGLPAYHTPGDCSLHKSQPLPSLSYGVPSANTYTASLSSLTTNIGGAYQGSALPPSSYGIPDLHSAHSQKVNTQSTQNTIETTNKESYGKSLGESLAQGGELIKSQSIDLNNIPLQGSMGSYTLQIQSADGLGQGPHGQVLNEGLLQSILSAIEQPQNKQDPQLSSGNEALQQGYFQVPFPTLGGPNVQDSEGQHSVTNVVVAQPPVTEPSKSMTDANNNSELDARTKLSLLDNNEIALYYNSNAAKTPEAEVEVDVKVSDGNPKNAQQYGSYVSFKTPTGSYVYGDLDLSKDAPKAQ